MTFVHHVLLFCFVLFPFQHHHGPASGRLSLLRTESAKPAGSGGATAPDSESKEKDNMNEEHDDAVMVHSESLSFTHDDLINPHIR